MDPILEIALISLGLSLAISFVYKFAIDQKEMKNLRKQSKECKEKMDKAKKENNQKEMNKYLNKMMDASQRQMKMTFKAMIITFLIVIPALWFLAGHYGDQVVKLEDVSNSLQGEIDGKTVVVSQNSFTIDDQSKKLGDIIKIEGKTYEIEHFNSDKNEIKFARVIVELPISIPFFGNIFGWLGWYILVSLPSTQIFRKLMGVI